MADRQRPWVCAMVVAALTAGCGTAEDGGGGAGADERPSASAGATSAPGLDGTADPERLFSDAELKNTLAPPSAFGTGLRSTSATAGDFDRYPERRRYRWNDCTPAGGSAPLKEDLRELETYRAASAERAAVKWGASQDATEPEVSVTQSLLSMSARDAGRYLTLQHDLHIHCGTVLQDMEAGVAVEHREVARLEGLGDEALLESSSTTGGDAYETPRRYTVEARVGGVILRIGRDGDKDKVVAWAAMLVRDIARKLYGDAHGS